MFNNFILINLILVCVFQHENAVGQTELRSTISCFKSISVNSNIDIVGGQNLSTLTIDETIACGYYPINHSLLNTPNTELQEVFFGPIPFHNFLNIESSSDYKIVTIAIYTIDGKLILTQPNDGNDVKINTSYFPLGFFIIQVTNESGDIISSKIIKT